MTRFVVWCPDWNHQSGGIRVMHRLVDLIKKAGMGAFYVGGINVF